MTMLESRKYDIIKWIISLADEKVIDAVQSLKQQVESEEKEVVEKQHTYSTSSYREIKSRTIDVEQLKKEQQYTPSSAAELQLIATEAAIEQPIEVLLQDLNDMG
jgi:hypothetical protein